MISRTSIVGISIVAVLAVAGGAALAGRHTSQVRTDASRTATPQAVTNSSTATVPGQKSYSKATPAPAPAPNIPAGGMALGFPTASVASGTSVELTIYENSGSEAVNAVQAALTYDASILQYSGSAGGDFEIVAATDSSQAGKILLARGTANRTLTGQKKVAVLKFKALHAGTASVTLDESDSQLVRTANATGMLKSVSGASVTVK
jgi:hypothetical protein